MENFVAWLNNFWPRLLGAALILLIGWYLINLLGKIMQRAMESKKVDGGAVTFFNSLLKVLLRIIIVITALGQFMDVTSIIAAVGAAGVTAGLALKDSLSNVASGALIIFTHPFRVGDYLLVQGQNGVEGTVKRIEIMFTTLASFDNKEIVIPNSSLTASTIINYTAMETRRIDLNYSISYSQNIAAVKQVLQKLVDENEKILRDPAPLIAVGEHKDSCVNMVVKIWCACDDYWPLYYEMQEKVKLAFDEQGISIPFPQLDVHLPKE